MHIFNLPPELLRDVLVSLDYRSLVAYSSTCRSNYIFASSCLSKLELGIYPLQQAAMLADSPQQCLPTDCSLEDTSDRTDIVLPPGQCKTHYLTIHNQNKITSRILRKHQRSLRSLDLSIWELGSETAEALSQASRLQHLTLRMNHPFARVKHMPHLFWYTSPGSTVWNKLYAAPTFSFLPTPPDSPYSSRSSSPIPSIPRAIFTELKTLHLERAGITDYQIGRIIEENPNLTEIRLRKCLTLTDEFFRDLSYSKTCFAGRSKSRKGLKVLHFELSTNQTIDQRILQYIGQLTELESLSFAGCSKLQNEQIEYLNQTEWNIPNLILPRLGDEMDAQNIEIDPAYMC